MVKPSFKSKALSVVLTGALAFGMCPTAAFATQTITPSLNNASLGLLDTEDEELAGTISVEMADDKYLFEPGETARIYVGYYDLGPDPDDPDEQIYSWRPKTGLASTDFSIVSETDNGGTPLSVSDFMETGNGYYTFKIPTTAPCDNYRISVADSEKSWSAWFEILYDLSVTPQKSTLTAGTNLTIAVKHNGTSFDPAGTGSFQCLLWNWDTDRDFDCDIVSSSNGNYTIKIPSDCPSGDCSITFSYTNGNAQYVGRTSIKVIAPANLGAIKMTPTSLVFTDKAAADQTLAIERVDEEPFSSSALASMKWSSADTSIAKVSTAKGTSSVSVTPQATGETTITATYTAEDNKTKTATCNVTVGTKVSLTPSLTVIPVGGTSTVNLTSTSHAALKDAKDVSSSSALVATAAVASNVVTVTGKDTGTATITVRDDDAFGTFDITVAKATSAATRSTLNVGESTTIVNTVQPTGTALTYEYTVTSGTNVVSVDTTGKVTAKAKGTATVRVRALHGTTEISSNDVTFTVNQNKTTLGAAHVKAIANQTYTGRAKKPAVKVVVGGKTLKAGTDYTVSHKNNKAIGLATAVIVGKGKYAGTVNKAFKIVPKAVGIKSIKAVKGGFNVKMKYTSSTNARGYQVRYDDWTWRTDSDSTFVKRGKTAVVRGLERKTTYKVQVRAYKIVNGAIYYSKWSGTKRVRTK